MRRLALLLLLLFSLPARAGTPPAVLEFVQRLDARLPLDVVLRDEAGRTVRIGDYFGKVPVALTLGYFHCPNLCSTLLDGMVEGLAGAGLPASGYRLLAVSIDPREDAAAARQKEKAYSRLLAGKVDAHFLTGEAVATARLAASLGFPYAWDAAAGQYAHPAGFVVATPDGRVARYFLGVRFAPLDIRLALVEASAGRVGTLSDRLLLRCSHYDPQSGRYSLAAMTAVRAVSLLAAVLLAAWIWRRRPGRAP